VNYLKKSFKIYIKIDIKTAPDMSASEQCNVHTPARTH